jgi:AraC-like DNA-binding protein
MRLLEDARTSPDFIRSLLIDHFVDQVSRRLFFKLVKVSQICVGDYGNRIHHLHCFYELIIPLSGTYQCRLNEEKLHIEPGKAVLVQPGDYHSDTYQAGSELMFVQFIIEDMYGQKWSNHIIDRDVPPRSRMLDVSGSPEIHTMIDLIKRNRQNNTCGLISLGKMCEVVLWNIIALIQPEHLSLEFSKMLDNDQFMEFSEKYFSSHITGTLDIEDFCRRLAMSRRTVEKKFMEVFNTSPHKMFIKLKIGFAAEMLKSGCSVKETASRLGFKDQFYFSTVFKRVNGYPPSTLSQDRLSLS